MGWRAADAFRRWGVKFGLKMERGSFGYSKLLLGGDGDIKGESKVGNVDFM